MADLTCLELCAGGGGQALGLERAGFTHARLTEIDGDACATLRRNRPDWPVTCGDIRELACHWNPHYGRKAGTLDLVAGGLPCTPHSRGGKQLGTGDERHLWDTALQIIAWARPRAVLLETSNAIFSHRFYWERTRTSRTLLELDYVTFWRVIDCSDYGVPQRRRRAVLVALRDKPSFCEFTWPEPDPGLPPTVGEVLLPLAAANGWDGAERWAKSAQGTAPTVVGGSRKHGGADLGASQGKAAWRKLGIDPLGVADAAPEPDGSYRRGLGKIGYADRTGLMLTVPMAAALQGFPADWEFRGRKTSAYRQVGNAFPPPVAEAIGTSIAKALLT